MVAVGLTNDLGREYQINLSKSIKIIFKSTYKKYKKYKNDKYIFYNFSKQAPKITEIKKDEINDFFALKKQ